MSTIKTTTLSTQGGSTVLVDTVVNGTAKAWVNFNGTGTVAIRRAFNVSSITDNGVGSYIINFTTAMEDTSYGLVTGFQYATNDIQMQTYYNYTTSSVYLDNKRPGVANYDATMLTVSIFS